MKRPRPSLGKASGSKRSRLRSSTAPKRHSRLDSGVTSTPLPKTTASSAVASASTLPDISTLTTAPAGTPNPPAAAQKPKIHLPPRTFGLKQVSPDPADNDATNAREVDIIVLHGLGARSDITFDAWKIDGDPLSGNVNWLRDANMLPAFIPEARILTYDWNADYDKTASSDRFLGHADTLLDRIHTDRSEKGILQRPIIFIASCFGGLLLAKALVRAADRFTTRSDAYNKILHYTIGVAFLGTPFMGSWQTGTNGAQLRLAVARSLEAEEGVEYSEELVKYLKMSSPDSPGPLDDLVQRFTEVTNHEAFRFPIVCFYETRHSDFSSYLKKLPEGFEQAALKNGHGVVVAQHSACLLGVERVALDVRHAMLHKYNSPENDAFRRLAMRLKDFKKKADATLRKKEMADATFSGKIKEPTIDSQQSTAATLPGRVTPSAEEEAAVSSPLPERTEGSAMVQQYNVRDKGKIVNRGIMGGVNGSHNTFTFGK